MKSSKQGRELVLKLEKRSNNGTLLPRFVTLESSNSEDAKGNANGKEQVLIINEYNASRRLQSAKN